MRVTPRNWPATVAVASFGTIPVALDAAVNIAFPAISAAFDVPVAAIQWVVIAYVLTDAVLLLPAGRLADRVGHRAVFAAGLALTGVALLLAGAAPAFGALLAARVLQGTGAALVFGSAPALVTLATPESRRPRALGWYNLAVGVGIVLGPLAGGALVGVGGWRAVYWSRVPLAAAALLLAWRWLPRAAPGPAAPTGEPAAPPIADRRMFVVANAVNLLANVALFFVWLLVPYYLLERRGLAPAAGGLVFAAGTLATAVGAPLGAWGAARVGARGLMPVALLTETLGLYLTSRLDAGSSLAPIALALALAGGGVGLFTVPNMHYVMGALPRARQGWAGSLVVLMRMGGILVGARLAALVYGSGAEADAFRDAFRVAAVIALVAAVLTLVPPRRADRGWGAT
jgi:MFS family permease